MNATDVNYPVGHLLKDMTCSVTFSGVRSRLVRIIVAKWIIRLAAHVAGMSAKVEIE